MTTDNNGTVSDGTSATEETKKDRNINQILALDTYDGLTDKEVRTLIAYKEKMVRFEEKINITRETATAMYENSALAVAACCEASNQVLQSIIESHTNFQGVTPTAVTSFLSSLEEV